MTGAGATPPRKVYPARRRAARTRGGRPVLSREAIAQAALEIAGSTGFPAVTMRAVAQRLSVSVAALYRHVSDRQTVVDLAAARFVDLLPEHQYDPSRGWQETLAELYQELRAAYRRYPRATLVAIDESLTIDRIPDSRVEGPERMIAFLCDLGLDSSVAMAIHSQLLLDVFAFVLLIDYRHDKAQQAGPVISFEDRSGLDTPRLIAAGRAFSTEPDALFRTVIDNAITLVQARLDASIGQ